ncbi:Maf family protein [Candidatus Colwellia aromaticivorans]|uniref:Maf family protein n=1 Tax=Candidatus Colwellia aromaticivorans TaxID=2267621 RepID=UPI001B350C13|nr:nucleoside triphosphate pyrophosphatase [Candidatus Colwellia aromaticivorans]
MKQLILASQSPRRKTLLGQLGYQFSTLVADIDESVCDHENAKDYVLRLAQEKALTIFHTLAHDQQKQSLVLGADTCVVIDGNILGKPANEAECIETLLRLENKQHQVFTAIAVAGYEAVDKTDLRSKIIETQVGFKALTLSEIKRYWQTGEPCDKAGSYAIQGIGGQFVTTINGSYSAVVGLPLYETALLLANSGLPTTIQYNGTNTSTL